MQVGVAYSEPGNQVWLNIEVADDATVLQAIEKSGVLRMFPHIDLMTQRVGIFSRPTTLDAGLRAGDRIEIYRPIICDPQTVPRRDLAGEEEE